jgi:indolepyruvate decarboxylase
MLMTTYAVGELSALNGVMGARAERSCVFHVVGMPAMRSQRVGQIIHHTLGDGVFQNFANISAQAACVAAVITPDNCAHEMERLIASARAESRPAYILVASDYAVTPVAASDLAPYPRANASKSATAQGPNVRNLSGSHFSRVFGMRRMASLEKRETGHPVFRYADSPLAYAHLCSALRKPGKFQGSATSLSVAR